MLLTFLEENFELFFGFCLLWVVGWATFYAWQRYTSKSDGPSIAEADVRFREKYVSGYSHETFFTRYGGAAGTLAVTVSKDAVLIEPVAFFKWIMPAGFNDLEHFVPKARITRVHPGSHRWRKSLQLEFRSDDGTQKKIEIFLRKPQKFLSALQG